jgi:two-component system, cell cycle response regulator
VYLNENRINIWFGPPFAVVTQDFAKRPPPIIDVGFQVAGILRSASFVATKASGHPRISQTQMATELTKVLLVDDDPAMLRLLAKWLKAEGYQVLRAGDGRKAMDVIEAEHPRLVVTDWEMPNVNGPELCRWLRSQNFGHYVYTIFLTIRSESADMVQGLEAGADDFLKKPVDRNELLARIRAGSRVMELERRLQLLANTDGMTGLPTRRVLSEDLRREWARSERQRTPLSCVMLDIDFFKRINDCHGHQAGDEVLRRFGQILGAGIRKGDFVGRYGGEEFCVVLPDTDEQHAVQWAERMRARIANSKIPIGETTQEITASFGVAQRLPDTSSPEALVDMADQALVVGKRSGRDRVVGYRSLTQPTVFSRASDDLASLLQGIPARDVMTSIVAPLNENHTVSTAANYFLRFRIPSAPVVDDCGQLVGIFSEKDLMSIMLGPRWWKIPIKDAMRRNVVCYEEETPALSIYEFLARVVIRGVVIVKHGRPTGLITRGCLLRFFMNLLSARQNDGVFPEVDAAASELVERMGQGRVKDRIGQIVRSLAAEACDMEFRLTDRDADLVPCVVGGASRMQELVIDLLAMSRYAEIWNDDPDQSEPVAGAQVPGAMRLAHAQESANQAGAEAPRGAN